MVISTPKGRSARRQPASATGLRVSEYEASMENHQVQPYGLPNAASSYAYNLQHRLDLCFMHRPRPKPRNFINMIRIEDYQEGSVHTVQEGDSSSLSGIASKASVHTKLQHHEDDGTKYDLDLPDHAPGFSEFPSFPPRRGDLIHVVSNDEPPAVGETEQERTAREACNIDRFNR